MTKKIKWFTALAFVALFALGICQIPKEKTSKNPYKYNRELSTGNTGADTLNMMPKTDMVMPAGKSEPSPFIPEPIFREIRKIQHREFIPAPDSKIGSREGLTIEGYLDGECLIRNEGERTIRIRLVRRSILDSSEQTISMYRLSPGDEMKQSLTINHAFYIYTDEGGLIDFLSTAKLSLYP